MTDPNANIEVDAINDGPGSHVVIAIVIFAALIGFGILGFGLCNLYKLLIPI